jgi:outer membrane biosynthesis protein TonB
MRRFRLNTGLIFASWALMLIFGCHKKKPPVPPEELPPTVIAEIPTEQPPSEGQQTEPQPQPQASNTPAPVKPKPPKHKSHPASPKKPADEPEKPAPTEEAKNAGPPKVVIQENGTTGGSGPPTTGAVNDSSAAGQASTQQLLDKAENNLRNIKRQLSDNEKSMVAQIQDWITQSKDAMKEGDNPRAHNLALKAQVLSDELVKGQ